MTVYNGKIEEAVSPGKTYIYTMTVQNSADSPADFGVEVDGYGTSANQDFVMCPGQIITARSLPGKC